MAFYDEDLPNKSGQEFEDESLLKPLTKERFEEALLSPAPHNIPTEEHVHRRLFNHSISMADIGERYDHYSQLLAYWEDAIELMKSRKFLGKDELIKLKGLEIARIQLQKTMQGIAGYGNKIIEIKILVDGVSDAKYIYGGRGTPLRTDVVDSYKDLT